MSQFPPQMPAPAPKKGLGTGAIIAIVAGVLVVICACGGVGVLLPALSKARDSARMIKSSTQMRAIYMSLVMYADANQSWLPPQGSDVPSLLPDVPPTMWQSPSAPPSGPSYYYVPLGRLDKIENPSSKVILYENPDMPRRGMWNVVFADGRIDVLQANEYRQLIDGITLPDGTPYTPHKP